MYVRNKPGNPRPKVLTARINVALTKDQRYWLEKYCARRGMTFSEFVREAIRRKQELQKCD